MCERYYSTGTHILFKDYILQSEIAVGDYKRIQYKLDSNWSNEEQMEFAFYLFRVLYIVHYAFSVHRHILLPCNCNKSFWSGEQRVEKIWFTIQWWERRNGYKDNSLNQRSVCLLLTSKYVTLLNFSHANFSQ